MEIFFVAPGIILTFSIFMMIRTFRVHAFLTSVLEIVSIKGQEDIDAGRNWEWRYEELDKVSFDSMMVRFWKPLKVKSFWKDDSFLRSVFN